VEFGRKSAPGATVGADRAKPDERRGAVLQQAASAGGGVGFSALNGASYNVSGAGTYKVGGTVVIDASRNISAVAGAFSGAISATNLSGTNRGDQTISLTGDVTGSGTGSFAATIASNSVTYAKVQQAGAAKRLGNPTGAAANVQEIALAAGLTFSGTSLTLGAITPASVAATGTITSSGGGVGYATGAGGIITQATSKSTGVTLNKLCGQTTTSSAALAANAEVSFTLTNSQVAATDTIDLVLASGNATAGAYNYQVEKVSGGSFVIWIQNISAGSLSEALVFNFSVKKAVAA
jgi:hypothetical protein